jgi:hypothetical protein
MPLSLPHAYPTILIRRSAYERSGLERASIDERFGLTPDEFRVEGDLIALGPLVGIDVADAIEALEDAGLVYYDDFFEWSGNWPEWLSVAVTAPAAPAAPRAPRAPRE